jgi:hypothetical protein
VTGARSRLGNTTGSKSTKRADTEETGRNGVAMEMSSSSGGPSRRDAAQPASLQLLTNQYTDVTQRLDQGSLLGGVGGHERISWGM